MWEVGIDIGKTNDPTTIAAIEERGEFLDLPACHAASATANTRSSCGPSRHASGLCSASTGGRILKFESSRRSRSVRSSSRPSPDATLSRSV